MKIFVGSLIQAPEIAVLDRETAGDDVWLALNRPFSEADRRAFLEAVAIFCANLARYHTGQPLFNVVDWDKGY